MRTSPSRITALHADEPAEPLALDTADDGPDALALFIEDARATRPDFADVWAPISLVTKIERERVRLGLSQADVAGRMGLARTAVAKLEADPTAVSFGRIMAYARAVGVELVAKPSKARPKPAPTGRGRRVAPKAVA